jgi:hypothetical protein
MSELLWRIYYDDGTTFDNTQAEEKPCPTCKGTGKSRPEFDAPVEGVASIINADAVWGRRVNHGYNMYFCDPHDNSWTGTNDEETMLRRLPGLVMGRMMSPGHLAHILDKSTSDPDFPTATPQRRKTDGNYHGDIYRQADIRRLLKRIFNDHIAAAIVDEELGSGKNIK